MLTRWPPPACRQCSFEPADSATSKLPWFREALAVLRPHDLDLIILENVGNLVCPAESDTGAHANVVILSVPEGDDKPLKYPLIFTVCDAVVVNKTDYLEIEQFDTEALRRRISRLNPRAAVCEVSCRTGAGLESWLRWLAARREDFSAQERSRVIVSSPTPPVQSWQRCARARSGPA